MLIEEIQSLKIGDIICNQSSDKDSKYRLTSIEKERWPKTEYIFYSLSSPDYWIVLRRERLWSRKIYNDNQNIMKWFTWKSNKLFWITYWWPPKYSNKWLSIILFWRYFTIYTNTTCENYWTSNVRLKLQKTRRTISETTSTVVAKISWKQLSRYWHYTNARLQYLMSLLISEKDITSKPLLPLETMTHLLQTKTNPSQSADMQEKKRLKKVWTPRK